MSEDAVDYYGGLGVWMEGAGFVYGNPFACELYGDEPVFGHHISVQSCVKDDKPVFLLEWLVEPASINERSVNTYQNNIYNLQGHCIQSPKNRGLYIKDVGFKMAGNYYNFVSCQLGDDVLFEQKDFNTLDVRASTFNDTKTPSTIFDLQGRRLNGEPRSGVYIMDGKKYVKH